MATNHLKVLIAVEASRLDGPIRNVLYAIELLRKDFDFVLVTFARPGLENNELIARLRADSWPLIVIPERWRFDVRALRIFAAVLRDQRPDVCQIHNTKSRLFVTMCASLLRIVSPHRLLFVFDGETWTTRLQRLYNRLDRYLLRLAARVVAVSGSQVPLLQGWGVRPERIRVIVNAIPVAAARARRDLAAGRAQRIMTAGRLSAEKGHRVLVQAVTLLPASIRQRLTLDVFGDGPEAEGLSQLISLLAVSDVVRLRGYRSELRSTYLEADLFVLPSLSEGLPNVLLEAAMAGVPIIATNVGGVPALFADGVDARLVPPGDPGAISRAISEFVERPDRYEQFAQRARATVVARHGPEAKARALADLYVEMSAAAETANQAGPAT